MLASAALRELLAIYKRNAFRVGLVSTGARSRQDVYAARVWAFNDRSRPAGRVVPAESHRSKSGKPGPTFYWDLPPVKK